MMRDEANDAFAVRRRQQFAGIADAFAKPIDPHSRPSGFSITSMTAGSSSQVAIDGPSAVRSIRAPRVLASERIG